MILYNATKQAESENFKFNSHRFIVKLLGASFGSFFLETQKMQIRNSSWFAVAAVLPHRHRWQYLMLLPHRINRIQISRQIVNRKLTMCTRCNGENLIRADTGWSITGARCNADHGLSGADDRRQLILNLSVCSQLMYYLTERNWTFGSKFRDNLTAGSGYEG